jgi:uncharacterized Rossmann fold enzyme
MSLLSPDISAASFGPVAGVSTVTATDLPVFLDNIKKTIARKLPRLQFLPEFNKTKGDTPIALVGGGPSLKNNLNELRKFRTIIACGSVNNYLMEQGIIPTYATACDPDPVVANYLTKNHPETKYLMASCSDDMVFEVLKERQVIIWHCHSPDQEPTIKEVDKEIGTYLAICGGCTVGLRSISIAILLGYTNIHFFGFDSCLENDDHHVYDFSSREEDSLLGHIHSVKLGNVAGNAPIDDKVYRCVGYQLAQAEHFREFYENFHHAFNPTFHGEGLLPDLMQLIHKRVEYLQSQKAA